MACSKPAARPIVVTPHFERIAQLTAASFTDPYEQGYPMLAMIKDFVLAKISPFGHIALSRALNL